MGTLVDSLRTAGSSQSMTAAGTFLTAGSQIASGISQRRAGDALATQEDAAAGQQQAASQRTAFERTREADVVASRAQAVAAASGGSATDPTVTNIVGRIAAEGAYRSQLALYQGDSAAAALHARADAARYGGKAAQAAGVTRAFGTVLKGGATMLDKYSGPKSALTSTDFGGVDPYADPSGWGMS